MCKIVLCSFANSKYGAGLRRLVHEAERSGLFDEIAAFGDDDLEDEYWNRYGEFIRSNPRGFGYWIWKSHIVNRVMDKLQDNDILVFLDAGCGINHRYAKEKFHRYVEMLRASENGILCFTTGLAESNWDKGDVIDYFGVRDRADILDSEQIMSGIWMMVKNDVTTALCRRWEEITHSDMHLVDDSPSASPDMEGFVENRHDQSLFSLLVKLTGGARVMGPDEVEVDFFVRDRGLRTYRRYRENIFLALREKDGLVYTCSNHGKQRGHERLWDIMNSIEDVRKTHHLLYTIFLKLPYLAMKPVDRHILRKYHQRIDDADRHMEK